MIGCGRVGSALSTPFAAEEHDVRIVVDRDPTSSRLLPANFSRTWHQGNGFNRAVLNGAGIEHADASVAVTSGDNSNIVAAHTAKDVYRVPLVVARIYEPRRADIYRRLGSSTVASVVWTVNRIHQMRLHRHLEPELTFGNSETLLLRSALPDYLVGRPLRELEVDAEIRVVSVTRTGRTFIPEPAATAEPADLVTFAIATHALGRLRTFLNKDLGT